MTVIQTRVDKDLKDRSDALFKDMGISTTEAIRLFLTQSVNQGRLPFQPVGKQPNLHTLKALSEEGGTTYKSVDELSKLWKS